MSVILPGKQQSISKKSPNLLKFKKATTDLGKLYENDIPIFVILKLLQNKTVKDFRISTNDDQFGNFDDFILEVDYTNKPTEKYAVQLKHKEKSTTLGKDKLEKSKDFGVMNYAKACQKIPTDYKVILFTNAKFRDTKDVIDLGNPEESVRVRLSKCKPSSVINTSEKGESYQFRFEPENSGEIKQEYNDFFERFFLYTNQMSAFQLHDEIQHSLDRLTSKHSVSLQFLKFISDWNIKLGIKFKLTKNMIVKVLTLRYVEELINPHTFCEVNDKKKILQKAISQFNITVFNNTSLDQVVKIWGDGKSLLRNYDIRRINEILRQFQIATRYIKDVDELTEEECTKLLWVMDKCPLILKDGPAVYEAAKLCGEKSNFVIITDDLRNEKLEQLTVFKTLSDLKRYKPTYNEIVQNFTFKLFGDETSFDNLIKENDDFGNFITTNEIAQITDTTDIIKLEEERLCFPYIKRYLYKNIIDFKYLQKLDGKTMVVISSVSDVKKLTNGLQNFEIVPIMDELHKDADDTNSKKEFQVGNNTFSKKHIQPSGRTKTGEEVDNQLKPDSQNFKNQLQNDTNITKDKKMNQRSSLTRPKLVFYQTETSLEEFTTICNKNKKFQRFHHLRYHDKFLEWIESIGDVSDLENFSTRSDVFVNDEEKYAENISHNVNIVISDPGMGKSLFLKRLKNNLLSKYLPVIILPRDISQLCQFMEHQTNLQKFFDFILETKFLKFESFERQVLKLLMLKRKLVLLWDALDELSEENRKFVEELIKTLSENSVVQFVTSRGFLRKKLEKKFKVLSQEIQPFNNKQLTDYIQRRLQDICSGEELETITTAIKKNIANTPYRFDILGIPLQIYMLTELFRQDLEKRKKLFIELFVITDMFFHFIDQKFYFHCIMEINYPAKNIDAETLSRRIKNYQLAAIKLIFGTAFYIESNKESDMFLTKIKEKGDEFGLITAVDLNMQPKFLHHSYAEYFAANYLAENCRRIPNLELIFDRKHMNVKYFFDSLLAKNSPAHIAVLCKNLKFLQDWRNTDAMKSKDLQGRNALHLAASWGEKYPLVEMSEIRDDPNDSITATFFQELRELNHSNIGTMIVINDNNNNKVKTENNEHYQILDTLVKVCDPNEVDELFKFTPTMYAEKCECLLTAAYIAKKEENRNYLSNKNEKFVYSLLYYGIKHGFSNIADLFGNLKFILTNNGNSILHMAAANNQIEYVKKLLSQKVYIQNIDYRNRLGKTALVTAVANGHQKIVEYIKQHNAKIDALENDVTSVMTATTEGHIDKMGHQQQQSSVYSANNLLILAAQKGHLETIKYLTQGGTNVNATLTNGRTLLLEAACSGNLEVVKYSIQNRAQIDAKDNNGFTSLMLAAQKGHYATVEYLVKKDADINTKSTNDSTPLLEAASYGHLEIVRYLVQHNAKIDAANNEGFTPLMVAALNGHLETVKYLTQNGADVNTTSRNLMRPLMVAARQGHLETVKYLTQKSADINATSASGRTSLMEAASHGHIQIVKYLIQQKAEIDEVDNDGFTPLIAAAQKGHIETVKYLAKQGADINWSSHNGRTALMEAAFKGHLEVVIYLKRNNAKSDGNSTSLMAAAQAGHLEIVRYLAQDPEFHAPSSNITTLK